MSVHDRRIHVSEMFCKGVLTYLLSIPEHYLKMVLNIRSRIFKSAKFLATLERQLINSVITELQLLSRVTDQ